PEKRDWLLGRRRSAYVAGRVPVPVRYGRKRQAYHRDQYQRCCYLIPYSAWWHGWYPAERHHYQDHHDPDEYTINDAGNNPAPGKQLPPFTEEEKENGKKKSNQVMKQQPGYDHNSPAG